MNVRIIGSGLFFSAALAVVACSSSAPRAGFEESKSPTEPGAGDPGSFTGQGKQGNGSCEQNNTGDPDKDYDGDGYPLKYDCNECDKNVNNGAFDVPGNGIDEDCNGTPDDEVVDCDTNLPFDGNDAMDAAKAIGLCKTASAGGKEWGVIEAQWVRPDGTLMTGSTGKAALGRGVLPKFGLLPPPAGANMLAISSGTARSPNDPGFSPVNGFDKDYDHGAPPGYPKDSSACGGGGFGGGFGFGGSYDGIALKVKIRVPSNAQSFKYQQNFFTAEFPQFVCQDYNDFFVTIMDPKPAGLPDGNIAFDQDKNPISVNNSFLQACSPQSAGGKQFKCPLGPSTLTGTGFQNHGSTGWLTTQAPVTELRGKEMTLMWAIWDEADGVWDSSALIDDFSWSVDAASGTQTKPSTPN